MRAASTTHAVRHRQIIDEIQQRFDLTPEESLHILHAKVFEGLDIPASRRRVDEFNELLGNEHARELLVRRPICLKAGTGCLQQRLEFFQTRHISRDEFVVIFARYPEIMERSLTDLELSWSSLSRHIGEEALVDLAKREPHILLISSTYLEPTRLPAWQQDADGFYHALCATVPLSATRPRKQLRYMDEMGRTIKAALEQRRVPANEAEQIAIRLRNAYGTQAIRSIELFLDKHDWSTADLYKLVMGERNQAWRTDPRPLFDAEQAMCRGGLSILDARALVIRHTCLSDVPNLDRIEPILHTLFRSGFKADEILNMVQREPRILHVETSKIDEWLMQSRTDNRLPLSYLNRLARETARSERAEDAPPPISTSRPTRAMSRMSDDDEQELIGPRNWLITIQHLLQLIQPVCTADQAIAFLHEHAWITNPANPAPRVLDTFARWLGLKRHPSPKSLAARCIAKIVRDPELHPLLTLSSATIIRRMQTLRVIGRDFQSKPNLLLHPWESIPPERLRFRVNEIAARNGDARRKPFLLMLLEPDAERFSYRLDRYLKRQAS